jgi:peptide/nickel transport system ATP-binding protein
MTDAAVLEARDLTRHYRLRRTGGMFGRKTRLRAVDGISLALRAREVVALVGESGSGKSTVARVLARLEPATSGDILLDGEPVRTDSGRGFRDYCRQVQIVFQDPYSSLNPLHTVRYHLSRPLKIHHYARGGSDLEDRLQSSLARVSLGPASQFLDKLPHELSGGQRQRIAVARAIAAGPRVLLADEPISMLDVSIRLGVLNLLEELKEELDLAMLYITHDIASARYFAQTTLVMYAGELVEGGASEEVTQRPAHPYTQLLISSAPDPERLDRPVPGGRAGEPPSLTAPPSGCRFHPRCPFAMPVCSTTAPPAVRLDANHWARCWLHSPSTAPSSEQGRI